MSDIVETAVEAAATTWWGKYRLLVILAGAVLAVILLALFYWLVFIRPGAAQQQAAASHGQAVIAQGGAQSAQQAIGTIQENHAGEAKTDTQTRVNYVYITKQPGAADPVNPALFDAFVQSVCLREAAADLPECQRLRQPDPAGLEDGREKRPPAGR